MIIKRLKAENFKKLKSVEMKPEGSLIVIGGRNGQGKSSLLESFLVIVGGKPLQSDLPVRVGQRKAVIEYDLVDLHLRLEIDHKEGKRKLVVTNSEGIEIPRAQEFIKRLYHKQAYDPLRFLSVPPKDQVDIVRKMVGLDFTEEDSERESAYKSRTAKNKEKKELDALISEIEFPEDTPDEEVSIPVLMEDLRAAQNYNSSSDVIIQKAEKCQEQIDLYFEEQQKQVLKIDGYEQEIKQHQEKIKKLQEDISVAERSRCDVAKYALLARKSRDDYRAEYKARENRDVKEIYVQINGAEQINKNIGKRRVLLGYEKKLVEVENDILRLNALMDSIDKAKSLKLQDTKMPYPGLTFELDELFLDGKPFSVQESSMKRKVAVSMLFNLIENECGQNAIKVILLLDSPYLDADSLAELEKIADAHDGMILIELGGTGPSCHVIIEDGLVLK